MQAWLLRPWALTATLESAYPMHPMGAQHSHEEEGLGSEPWPGPARRILCGGVHYPGDANNVTLNQSLLRQSVFAVCKL